MAGIDLGLGADGDVEEDKALLMSLTGQPLPAHALSRAPPKGGSQPPTSHSSSASAAWCARNGELKREAAQVASSSPVEAARSMASSTM
uniref:Uncharacterized protein n=1 Tax=Oryza sativa subsp. japonica TaxID=39947 RepID=Q5Z9D2_ORYSJ|nr:hypothetical protein [Oryza sativa Japonica Group]